MQLYVATTPIGDIDISTFDNIINKTLLHIIVKMSLIKWPI